MKPDRAGEEARQGRGGPHERQPGADPEPRPSPLTFWYRRSDAAMTGVQFHHDLLTPGIVTPDDPAPIGSGMMQLTLDHRGLLTFFEAIPPQVVETPPPSATVDWAPLFELAGLDRAQLQEAEPLWTSLAASDVRVAWTGTWPGTTRPPCPSRSRSRGPAATPAS